MTLTRGPVGDPHSRDPFERAQAQAPDGWHVEGQFKGMTMEASGPTRCDCNGTGVGCRTSWVRVRATGKNHLASADLLVIEMRQAVEP